MLGESSNDSKCDGCLSALTYLFVKEAQYAQITKDEALLACQSVLTDQDISLRFTELLFSSLIENNVLVASSKNIFLTHQVSTQSMLVQLTRCYSPVCKSLSTSSCYSPCCPNRGLVNLHLNESLDTGNEDDWISKIPRYILKELSPKEKKRQLAIEELVNYEDNFLKQLKVIRDTFALPLLSSQITIEESRRFSFHDKLFGNYYVLANHHKRLLRDLESLRDVSDHNLFPDSTTVGLVLLKHFSKLADIYVRYATNYVFAEYLYKTELSKNLAFSNFIKQQETLEKDFRLPLKGLLISPIVRMTKYDLLFATILKNSEEDQRDIMAETIAISDDISQKMNEATGRAKAEQRLLEIRDGLRVRRPSMRYQHRLQQIMPDNASLLFEGTANLTKPPPIPPIACRLFLFSNALLITRIRAVADGESEFVLVDKPIPLHMLRIGKPSKSRLIGAQQTSILTSLRRQLSGSGSNYSYRRRYHSESGTRTIEIASDVRSDDSSSTYSAVYTISGLKIRHRIKNIKQRIRKKHNGSADKLAMVLSSSSSVPLSSNTKEVHTPAPLQKSATFPARTDTIRLIRSRLLQINHVADPNLSYLFECSSIEERLLWKNKIKSVLPNPDKGPFGLGLICRSPNVTQLQTVDGRYMTGCGTIWCSLPFVTSEGRDAIALGSRYGLWVAYRNPTEPFRHILSYNCQQLDLFDNRILLARGYRPNRVLGAISIDHICSASSTVNLKEFQVLQKSGVLHFAVGTLGGEPILCYLRRRRTGSVRLVLMFYRADGFKKFKEYKPLFIQPSDLQIIDDHVYIRSPLEGIEKVDLLSWITHSNNSNNSSSSGISIHQQKYSYRIDLPAPYHIAMIGNHQTDDPALTTIGYVPLSQPGTGLICSGQFASPVADVNADSLQQEIEFEAEARSVVVYYPYLIAFSSNVIEIRHLETTALVQAIAGSKIRCLYVSRATSQTAPTIHVSMLHAEQDQTKVHQLYLRDPISLDE